VAARKPKGAPGPSRPGTVAAYLAALPKGRRTEVEKVRALVRRHLPRGYEEGLASGMIAWSIPLARYPDTYNKQPLMYAALAAQKSHIALYLMGAYADPAVAGRLAEGFRKAGKKLDMGKSCVRFRTADDLAMEAIGEAVASVPPSALIARYEASRRR
jgi:hypothetical protein